MEKQNGKYFTIWYGVFNRVKRTLTYSNGGHPPALLHTGASASQASLSKLESVGMAAGMMEGLDFDSVTVELGPFARLLVYSDGVYEIAQPDKPMWSVHEFVEYVSSLPREEPAADRLLTHVRQLHGSDILADDFSFLEVWL
jgi:sigma-B regulation protein RsbU (phosphoserine phosphatase)